MKPQGVLPFVVQVVPDDDKVTARAGLSLVVEAFRAFGLPKVIAQNVIIRQRASGVAESEMIESFVLMLADGGEHVADMNILRTDAGLQRLLGRKIPSKDAALEFLHAFHDEDLIERAKAQRKPEQKAYIPEESPALNGLGVVSEELVRRATSGLDLRKGTLDHDATIQECHKQSALPHYKGGRGYQPSAILWAEAGMALADEYRGGNVPAAMSNLPLIQRGFAALPATVEEYAFRADSACYEDAVLKWLSNSADMTKELREACSNEAVEWHLFEDRPDETVTWAEVEFVPGDWPKNADPLRYVALKIEKKQGRLFASGADTKHLAVVTNLSDDTEGAEVIRWHRKKAGTIELLHDISKNELGARLPPSGFFGANAAWYRISLLTFNLLVALKLHALPTDLSKARPKRLRYTVFTLAARISSHAGRLIAKVGRTSEKFAGFVAAREALSNINEHFSSA